MMSKKILMIMMMMNLLVVNSCHKQVTDFDNFKKIVSNADECSFEGFNNHHPFVDDEHVYIEFTKFDGSCTLWFIECIKPSTLLIEYDLQLIEGRFKLVLINPKNQVEKIVDSKEEGVFSTNMFIGKYRIKIIGENASGEIDVIITPGSNLKVEWNRDDPAEN